MLLIHCPYCGEDRSELEFRNAQDAHIVRPTNITELNDEEFVEFLYWRDNPKGIILERWRHIHGCGRFFNAARDTVSDRFLLTYKAGEPKPDINQLAQPAKSATPSNQPASAAAAVKEETGK